MNLKSIKLSRMYDDLAYLWPLISPPSDYEEEAGYWRQILHEKLGPERRHVLELGVGGGHNLSHLTPYFDATAVDVSVKMLSNSAKLNPEVQHVVGDMRSVRLNRKFAAVLIHDAINYMLTEEDLLYTFQTASVHLNRGGILLVAPDHYKETFHSPTVTHSTNSKGDIELTYIEYSYDPDPTDSTIESVMFYLIREKGKMRIEHDRHVTGIYPRETWLELLNQAGFDPEEHLLPLDEGRYPRLVGTLR